MTEIADDRSWWADVEHLRPGGDGHRVPAPRPTAPDVPTDLRDDRPVRRDAPAADTDRRPSARPARSVLIERDERPAPASTPRRGRITGAPVKDAPRPRRPEVAAFADALDLDGAFGAPVAARSREIILTGTPATAEPEGGLVDDRFALEPVDRYLAEADAEAVAADDLAPEDRKTVRITGNPGLHAQVAERRALREIGERRPRSAVERAVHRPDRIAMYVVLLGVFLVFVAAFTSSAGS